MKTKQPLTSRVTKKGQATIPGKIRKILNIHSGDRVMFSISDTQEVTMKKAGPIDTQYLEALEQTVSSEWSSSADNDAYNDL